ncbi:hypothetical protein D2V93_08040 [Flagellimonas taeanensis]|uniref:hypothetical protein n=1 Tax=Flavobacteriaceae TaxID=49546 RepID=UPI000E69C19E|nr:MULTISPECIES: hypothetical protein [Allomuricauda]MDC6385892.1 hypothetical protein [Muricauda sp. SK9]RIV50822.1 hypothetical protein D2V93_08040 [Allomuricauda taeanensis]
MENSTTISMRHSRSEHKANGWNNMYKLAFREFKNKQLGYSTIAIIAQSCLGSAAAMFLLMGALDMILKMVLLFFITIFCMAFNGAVLAQLKPLYTFNLLILSVIFSSLVIIAHII